ncbi:NADH-ubiquinone oxidoreductase B18 subunit-domain-containing protein [Fimicolochytrium jonesii]|uniref:NADH-ubiquinone oxidoreductase B18 subunit-domain-containing protein n=1 Tax=Fimicolochytrium jonesii TaxID=1396493 RepID=UPI0022FF1D50|nr:NADH-ubiquinone oxidoreductase B18 subunit-domain-containing protein [Fimicolochytrium jonesii]KAI8817815.1 NADH-ubiquinone oxidoreductase B18 subunit-domain-containing protein [Fimicolochytrium jonesii]
MPSHIHAEAAHHSDHDDAGAPPPTYITAQELSKTQIPLAWRDYCAHLLPALNECRKREYYLPWKCEFERVAWMKCQYDDYQRRMRKLAKRTAKQASERDAARAADVKGELE